MTTGTCETCKWWVLSDSYSYVLETPIDPDTMEPMEGAIVVKRCTSPNLLFCERPMDHNQAAIFDGSEYFGMLVTGSKFGCVNWEQKQAEVVE